MLNAQKRSEFKGWNWEKKKKPAKSGRGQGGDDG